MTTLNVHGRTVTSERDAGPEALLSASLVVLVTKHDTTLLTDGVCRALWVGTAGTANLTMADADDTEVTDFPLQVGLNQLMVQRVKTGGTADDIWAMD
jgi:hypothetical protein